MSPVLSRVLVAAGLVLVLGSVTYAIYGKERIIGGGATIFLELAPVDPRSLMQGDYMALRFALAEAIEAQRDVGERGRARTAALAIDDRGIATLRGTLADDAGDAPVIAFRIRGGRVWLGTNAYFFAERTADRYANARYGEFKLDPASGDAVLVALRDAALEPL
jgi:uncharacterized membrane-anchored protein